jgi:hypothetical protein
LPIVFVHGVNTRKGPAYEAGTQAIQAFAEKHLNGATIGGKALPARPVVSFPYWGDLGSSFAWNMESLPHGEMQALGGTADPAMQELLAHLRDALPQLQTQQPLTALARKRLSLAIEVINELALNSATAGGEAEVAAFVVAASAYADANPHPAWLDSIQTDQDLLNTLRTKVAAPGEVQALGGFGAVFSKISLAGAKFKQAAQSMAGSAVDTVGDFASTKLLATARDPLNETLGRFFGDVFIYLQSRGAAGAPGPIPALVLAAFDAARAAAPNEPLVIIGHSLGGVITFDVLSHFRPDITVDLFVSVGSQIAHFEELKLFKASDRKIGAPQHASAPANIKRWINIYDEVDIFSYAADRVFSPINVDARYDTETFVIKAHGAYFKQDRFYTRLRARIDGLP